MFEKHEKIMFWNLKKDMVKSWHVILERAEKK